MGRAVLLVDDNYLTIEGLRQSVNWVLLDIDQVFYTHDGQTALDMLQTQPVDLIISDISMPGLSGLELSELVMEQNPSVKIILISAYDEFEYARKAVHIGAFDYIEKPLNYEALTETLKRAIEEIEREKKSLEILKKSRPAMEEQFFRSLLHQTSAEEKDTLSQYYEYLHLHTDCNAYAAVQISIENSDLLRQKFGVEEYHVRMMNLERSFHKVCAEYPLHVLLKDFTGYTCILGGYVESLREMKNQITESFEQIAQLYQERFDMVIGLGTVEDSLWKLSASFRQAEKAINSKFFFPHQTVLEAVHFSGSDHTILFDLMDKEEALIELICKNQQSAIRHWITEFTESCSNTGATRALAFAAFYSVVSRLIKFCLEMDVSLTFEKSDLTLVFAEQERFQTIAQIGQWLEAFCLNICEALQLSMESYHQSLCKSAMNYIRQYYRESELNLNEIAEHVQITPSYLSTLFKKYVGQNISNYITDIRIEAACSLLKNTTKSLKVISEEVGYSNQYYFSSSFKKKTGQTPSAYRET